MPKLSLYRPNKQNDYRFFDRTISEQLTVGGTDLYIHKYLGPTNQGPSIDYTQPEYDSLDPTRIQDLLFLENRDRTYDTSIYRLRGHYNVQNLDFDLSQFGLFLNNDIIFITVHYNDMIDIVGRKLMVGDVLELPHLVDYNPLKETIPVALRRFFQITDANYASEGFSQTWFPHLWRIKCEPLIDSQEFSQILNEPINQDNYLGLWDIDKEYPAGYVITYGDKNYLSIQTVPAGTDPPDPIYWTEQTNDKLRDIITTYNRNIQINDANLDEAKRLVPLSGYDNSNLYVVPTYGVYETNDVLSNKEGQPAPPINIIIGTFSQVATGQVMSIQSPRYKLASPVIKIKKEVVDGITSSLGGTAVFEKFTASNLQMVEYKPQLSMSGSGSLETTKLLSIIPGTVITGPYGTADNTYATADQDPTAPGFIGEITPWMDYRADCDPRFQYIARATPRSFGYSAGYLTGTEEAPNGIPTGVGIVFPQNPEVGDYFLRIDYFPQVLFRWDGKLWVRISANVRTETGFQSDANESLLSSFINNSNTMTLTSGTVTTQAQPLSTVLEQPYPPITPIP